MNLEELFEYEFKGRPMIRKDVLKHAKKFAKNTDYVGKYATAEIREKMEEYFSSKGWTKLGHGSYSVVFLHPKRNYVLKLNLTEDQGFDHFVEVIHANPNPHFPRIEDATVFFKHKLGNIYRAYLMERLEPISTYIDSDLSFFLQKVACQPNSSDGKIIYDFKNTFEYIWRRIQPVPDNLVTAAKIIGRNTKFKAYLDIHAKNIMQRKDGTVVITDPYI